MNYICHSDFSIVDTYIAYEICSGRGSCNGAASNVISDVQEPTECPSRGRNQPLSANPLSVSFEYECIEGLFRLIPLFSVALQEELVSGNGEMYAKYW